MGVFLTCLACAVAAAAAAGEGGGSLYVKHETWSATMTAARQAFQAAGNDPALEIGPWHTTGALKADGFAHALFPEQGVDLQAKTADGKPLWTPQPDWKDGGVINLPGGDSQSTYLFRTIQAAGPVTLTASFGSDDGLEVWFNGEKAVSTDVPRVAAPNQDRTALSLKPGENRLLLKIYNRSGGHAFFFALADQRLDAIWRQMAADFPRQARWFEQSVGGDGVMAWFRLTSTAAEERIVTDALDRLDGLADGLKNELGALKAEAASAHDSRWLTLFERARLASDNVDLLNRVNLAAVRRAVRPADGLPRPVPQWPGAGRAHCRAGGDGPAGTPGPARSPARRGERPRRGGRSGGRVAARSPAGQSAARF